MDDSATDAVWLAGKKVAFTGRLATMTLSEAAELIQSFGGDLVRSVSPDTSLLVIGQEGWPLKTDGRLTVKLQKARRLQRAGAPIAILSEEELLARLQLDGRADGVRRLYTMGQLSRLLRVPRDRIRAWVRAGVIQPVETFHGVAYFDFRQVSGAKTLCDLLERGVGLDRIQKSLRQLRRWTASVDEPLSRLALLERDGRVLVRLGSGQLADPAGQLHFDYAEPPAGGNGVAELPAPAAEPNDWFHKGCQREEAGELADAAAAYRQAIAEDEADAAAHFNLGNVLAKRRETAEAADQFRQAVELEPSLAAAWNNLGNMLAELGRPADAVAAYERAIEISPAYADAHFNLADTLTLAGRTREAASHWQTYLRLSPRGEWAQHARRQLARRR